MTDDPSSGVSRNGGLNTPEALAAYNQRVADIMGLNRALQVAYAPGDPTEADWAAANVTPQQRAEATRQDLQTSADRASANFSSNMLPLAFLGAAFGGEYLPQLLGSGGGAAGTVGEGALSPLVPGSINSWGPVAHVVADGAAGTAASGLGLSDLLTAKNIAGALGGVAGALGSSQGSAQNSNGQKEPWGPAQDWMKHNIATGQQLQQYYQQNPFNAQQRAGMQNTFTDADQFRSSVMPGLLDFANGMVGSNYARQRGGAPGAGGGYGGTALPAGSSQGSGGTFGMAPGQRFGLIDWDGSNPYTQQK